MNSKLSKAGLRFVFPVYRFDVSKNKCTILLCFQARLFDDPQISSLCLDTIDKSTAEAVNAEGFTDIDLGKRAFYQSNVSNKCCLFWEDLIMILCAVDTLCAVLERDTLNIRENRLFEAVVHWAEAECSRQQLPATSENKQKVLGKALPLIRFPLMSVEKFPTGKLSTYSLATVLSTHVPCNVIQYKIYLYQDNSVIWTKPGLKARDTVTIMFANAPIFFQCALVKTSSGHTAQVHVLMLLPEHTAKAL